MTLEEFRTYIIQLHNQSVEVDQIEPVISYEGSEIKKLSKHSLIGIGAYVCTRKCIYRYG